jgi:hypothetical protein
VGVSRKGRESAFRVKVLHALLCPMLLLVAEGFLIRSCNPLSTVKSLILLSAKQLLHLYSTTSRHIV